MKKFYEWLSIRVAKAPRSVVLISIILANILLFCLAAFVISLLSPPSLTHNDFWSSVFYTVSMVLDAGCVSYVISDIGEASVLLIIVCLITVLTGMIVFSGAVIGYISSWISDFIGNAGAGRRRLRMTGHIIMINWNSRAFEIINDMLYKQRREKLVVLVPCDKERIEREIGQRIGDTIAREREGGSRFRNTLTVLVRQGEAYSISQLESICLGQAKSIILLTQEQREACPGLRGDVNVIKAFVQVAHMAADERSADQQRVVVEVDDDWTLSLVNQITAHKRRQGKCDIVPVAVNNLLGQIFPQFCIMPELNMVYSTLFSNQGVSIFSVPLDGETGERAFIEGMLERTDSAVPLTVMKNQDGGFSGYYMARSAEDLTARGEPTDPPFAVKLRRHGSMGRRNVVILGSNSKSEAVMRGFDDFRGEWQEAGQAEILNMMIVDDEAALKAHDDYHDKPYVARTVAASLYQHETICAAVADFILSNTGYMCILILSDDRASGAQQDAVALAYLVYIRDVFARCKAARDDFNPDDVDVVVEIIDPENFDVVHNYNVNHIVISNRYISRLIGQLSDKRDLYDFFKDILTYDGGQGAGFDSKEIYIKPVSGFFTETPAPCTAAQLIRAVYAASAQGDHVIVLGYFTADGRMTLFDCHQSAVRVALAPEDRLILFAAH